MGGARSSYDGRSQPQKAIMYGWLQGAKAKPHAPSRHAQWINSCFKQAGIPESDWFRLAQHRDKWKQLVYAKFPPERVCSTKETMLDNWRPGRPVPQFAQPHGERVEQNEEAQGCDEDIGEVRRGRPRHRARRAYRQAQRDGVPIGQRQQRAHRNSAGQWQCPVCAAVFPKPNQLTFHYESEHGVVDPSLVTVPVFPCPDCTQAYRRKRQLDQAATS